MVMWSQYAFDHGNDGRPLQSLCWKVASSFISMYLREFILHDLSLIIVVDIGFVISLFENIRVSKAEFPIIISGGRGVKRTLFLS